MKGVVFADGSFFLQEFVLVDKLITKSQSSIVSKA